jgi:hypothetical protein
MRLSRVSPARQAGRPRPAPPARYAPAPKMVPATLARHPCGSLRAALPCRAGAGRPRPSGAGHVVRSVRRLRSRKIGAAIPRDEFGLCDPRSSQATTGASVRLTSVAQAHPYSSRLRAERAYEPRRFSGPRKPAADGQCRRGTCTAARAVPITSTSDAFRGFGLRVRETACAGRALTSARRRSGRRSAGPSNPSAASTWTAVRGDGSCRGGIPTQSPRPARSSPAVPGT